MIYRRFILFTLGVIFCIAGCTGQQRTTSIDPVILGRMKSESNQNDSVDRLGTELEETLQVTIVKIVSLQQFEGTMVPVSVDPRFVLTVRLLKPSKILNAKEDEIVDFGVHSIARMFAQDDVPGEGAIYEVGISRQEDAIDITSTKFVR